MKAFLIFFFVCLSAVAVERTPQQEAELRDWITGIQKLADDAQQRADQAEVEAKASRDQSAIAAVKLKDAGEKLDDLQQKFNLLQKERDDAVEHDRKATALASRFATIIGVELAFIVFLACIQLGLPKIEPYGVAATCILPLLALGVVKLLPHL